MRVSCPQSIGYGGAMGPAQFIASTWTLLISRIKQPSAFPLRRILGHPLDAFMASAIYLSDLGADSTSYTAQKKNAACKYYFRPFLRLCFRRTAYGNSVMALANTIQTTEIDPLNGL